MWTCREEKYVEPRRRANREYVLREIGGEINERRGRVDRGIAGRVAGSLSPGTRIKSFGKINLFSSTTNLPRTFDARVYGQRAVDRHRGHDVADRVRQIAVVESVPFAVGFFPVSTIAAARGLRRRRDRRR